MNDFHFILYAVLGRKGFLYFAQENMKEVKYA